MLENWLKTRLDFGGVADCSCVLSTGGNIQCCPSHFARDHRSFRPIGLGLELGGGVTRNFFPPIYRGGFCIEIFFLYVEGLFAMEEWFFASRNVFPCSEEGVLTFLKFFSPLAKPLGSKPKSRGRRRGWCGGGWEVRVGVASKILYDLTRIEERHWRCNTEMLEIKNPRIDPTFFWKMNSVTAVFPMNQCQWKCQTYLFGELTIHTNKTSMKTF